LELGIEKKTIEIVYESFASFDYVQRLFKKIDNIKTFSKFSEFIFRNTSTIN